MEKIKIWKAEEINFLKIEFIKGTKIKIIARMLERTPTAVNKALDRFNIRQKKPVLLKQVSVMDLGKSLKPRQTKISSLKKICLEHWVSFSEVLAYLKGKGMEIIPIIFSNSNHYSLGDKILNAQGVLLVANKLRDACREPIFLVPDVTF